MFVAKIDLTEILEENGQVVIRRQTITQEYTTRPAMDAAYYALLELPNVHVNAVSMS